MRLLVVFGVFLTLSVCVVHSLHCTRIEDNFLKKDVKEVKTDKGKCAMQFSYGCILALDAIPDGKVGECVHEAGASSVICYCNTDFCNENFEDSIKKAKAAAPGKLDKCDFKAEANNKKKVSAPPSATSAATESPKGVSGASGASDASTAPDTQPASENKDPPATSPKSGTSWLSPVCSLLLVIVPLFL